mgnify:CR=1 FL=1
MARIRTVKPEFFQHEEIGALPFAARLLAIGLMQIADGHGRLRWVPKQIEAHVFPWDDIDLEPLAVGLESVGILVRYEVDGRSFGAFPNFRKHQRITGKEAAIPSKYPHHDDATTDEVNTQERPGETPRHAPGKHLDAQEQGTGNREQGTGSPEGASAPVSVSSKAVDAVWASWRALNTTARKTPTAGQRKTIRARLKDYSVEDLGDYFRWLREAPHKRAVFCRTEGHDGFKSTLLPGNCDERMTWVAEWTGGGSVVAPVEAPPAERYPRWLEDAVMQKVYVEKLQPADLTVELLQQHPRIAEVPEAFQLEVIGACFEQKGWKR